MSLINWTDSVARIVAEHPEAGAVFQGYRIDFCCHGQARLDQVCEDPVQRRRIEEEVEAAVAAAGEEMPQPARLGTVELVYWITDHHHGYLRRVLPSISELAGKVAAVHGDRNPRLGAVRDGVVRLRGMIEPHLQEEEQVLFPLLVAPWSNPHGIEDQLESMFGEHLEVGSQLHELRQLAESYTTPWWGCGSYRRLMSLLEELEGDLLSHIHVENHVLMPRFISAGPQAAPPL